MLSRVSLDTGFHTNWYLSRCSITEAMIYEPAECVRFAPTVPYKHELEESLDSFLLHSSFYTGGHFNLLVKKKITGGGTTAFLPASLSFRLTPAQ